MKMITMSRKESIAWEHRDVSNSSVKISGAPEGSNAAELEPMGMNAGAFHLIAPPPSPFNHPPLKDARSYPGFADSASDQCKMDFIDVPCDMAHSVIQSEAGVQCPNNDCGRGWGTDQTEAYYANNDGYSGYLPADARYYGKGQFHSASKSSRANNEELAGVITLAKSESFIFKGVFTQNIGPQELGQQDKYPCPPTGNDLANNPDFAQASQTANKQARSNGKYIESGGWVLMNRNGDLKWQMKATEHQDRGDTVYGLGEPQKYVGNLMKRGWIVIADFHTHDYEIGNPVDVERALKRGVPGIWIFPSGNARAYGPNRGLFGKTLPKGC
jgi:hypothetical protein